MGRTKRKRGKRNEETAATVPSDSPPPPTSAREPWLRLAFAAGLIVVVTLVSYLPAIRGGFIWDDDYYVTGNTMLKSAAGLWRIWFEPGATIQYYPLVFSSFWVEHQLWQLNAAGYHITNVVLHASGAVLAWFVLRALRLPGAWLAAAIFALHPVHVESVAWITERKNVLSGVCYLAAMLACIRFYRLDDPKPDTARRRWRYYALVWLLFPCALFSKTVTCTLPPTVLLLLWWKVGRLKSRDIIPVVPMLAASVLMGMVTISMELNSVGTNATDIDLSYVERCLIAGRAPWFYLGKLLWPANLTFIYPRWMVDPAEATNYLYPAATVSLLIGLWLLRGRIGKAPLVAILFFGGTLFPALGFVNVFPMLYSFVADHFQYLASLGPLALIAGGIATIGGRTRRFVLSQPAVAPVGGRLSTAATQQRNTAHNPRWRLLAASVMPILGTTVLLAGLATLTWQQCKSYKDQETLWRDTLSRNPGAAMAHINLANILDRRGEYDEAIEHMRVVVGTNAHLLPPLILGRAHYNLGNTLARQGKTEEAIECYREALAVRPPYTNAHNGLALMLRWAGRLDEAAEQYLKALEAQPDSADAHLNLGQTLFQQKKFTEAIDHYRGALDIAPQHYEAHYGLGLALERAGRIDEAVDAFERAVRINPEYQPARRALDSALGKRGRTSGQ